MKQKIKKNQNTILFKPLKKLINLLIWVLVIWIHSKIQMSRNHYPAVSPETPSVRMV